MVRNLPGLPSDRQMVVKKSRILASFLSWTVPTAGHAYAGDWGRTRFFAGVRAVGLGSYVVGRKTDRDALSSIGMSYLAIGRVGEIIDAWWTASDHNRLSRRLALAPMGRGLRVTFPLP
jgi:hypothetical protein